MKNFKDSIDEFIDGFEHRMFILRMNYSRRVHFDGGFSVYNYMLVKAECEAINVSLYSFYISFRKDLTFAKKNKLNNEIVRVWFDKYPSVDDVPYQLGSITQTIRGE